MKLQNIYPLTILIAISFLLLNCRDGSNPFEVDYSTVPDPFSVEGITPDTSETGLITYRLQAGSGPFEVTIRDRVLMYYTGRKTNGEIFDSSYGNGSTTPSNLAVDGVVEGFREGILGMKEGEKKVLIIPPSLAYGNNEGHSLQNDTLIFDLELETILD